MNDFAKVPNIGNVLAKKLNNIGISSIEELQSTGSREVFLRLRIVDPTTCVNTLCALEGAVQNIRWHHLDDKTKADLKFFYHEVSMASKED